MTARYRFLYFFALIISITEIQCSSTHHPESKKEGYASLYISQFRLTYFRQMLIKGFNHSKAIQEIIGFDHSGFTEPLLTIEDLQLIDSLTTLDNRKMQMDSIRRIGRVAEGAEGKHPLEAILEKLDSKWLDSLAKKRYKRSSASGIYPE